MPRKRQRYTVRFHDGREPQVALCYDPEWCWDHFDNVASVTKGDYRSLKAKPKSGARPHQANLQEAIRFLEIQFPVEVKVTGRADWQWGSHRVEPTHYAIGKRGEKFFGTDLVPAEDGRWVHRIRVHESLSAEEMGRTLWHELTHAMQFERDVPMTGSVRDAMQTSHKHYRDGKAYKAKAAEIEADSMMEHNHELPLAS
jgi:hypothetical protein